jgi:hypothetical protein
MTKIESSKGMLLQVVHKYSHGHNGVVLCVAPRLKYGHVVASFLLLEAHVDTFRGKGSLCDAGIT